MTSRSAGRACSTESSDDRLDRRRRDDVRQAVREDASLSGTASADYSTLVDCADTTCQRPPRRSHTSVQRYQPVVTRWRLTLFSMLLPTATATSPNTRTSISMIVDFDNDVIRFSSSAWVFVISSPFEPTNTQS